jgi:hypothetical protein
VSGAAAAVARAAQHRAFRILRVSTLLLFTRFPALLLLKQLLGGGVNSSAEFFASGKVQFSFFNPPLHEQSQSAISPRSRQSRIQFQSLIEVRNGLRIILSFRQDNSAMRPGVSEIRVPARGSDLLRLSPGPGSRATLCRDC